MQSKNKINTSTLLSCRKVSKTLGTKQLLKDVTFSLRKGEKVGVVGANGVGKTTLLKILAGELAVDEGVVSRGQKIKVAYMPQEQLVPDLSGGEAAKKILIPLMKSGADIFLLDEPTNNLDIDGLEMLERFLKNSPATFLLVSHDRTFLDKTVSKIIEINKQSKTADIYDGNYSAYVESKHATTAIAWQNYKQKVATSKKLSRDLDRKIGWQGKIEETRHNIKNLPIHEREKPFAADLRDKEGRAGKRAKVVKKRLERFATETSEISKPAFELPLKVSFDDVEGSNKVFVTTQLEKVMGKKLIGPLNFNIQFGDRVHIKGVNGAGKTTLLKILMQAIEPNKGELVFGKNVRIGYVPQFRLETEKDLSVIEYFVLVTKLDETMSRRVLNRFRINDTGVLKKLSELSPGEYSRLIIATIMAQKPNCLILDEPTNHLDLEVLEELESALRDFKGTLIVVSHDRYFVEKMELNKIIDLDSLV